MQLDTTGFPRVRAQLWPRDGEGRIVEGLTGAAFGLTDARAPRGATLVANSATPRFRILLDVTASQPLDFIVTSAEDFIAELTATLRARFPLASIDFAESWDDWGVPVDASRGQTPPTHILWITDGGMTDVLTPEREAQLRAGPQVVIISTLADVDPLGAQMALLTGGRVLVAPQSDPATARSVGEEIAASLVPAGAPYVLTYDAQLDGPPERVCRVELMTSAVSAEATYTAPAEVDAFGQLVGLRLRVQVGDVVCVRRLAGPIDPSRASPRTPSELQAVRDELTSAMLGVTYLGVEGGFPTRAVWLDDLLQARLGKARLFGLLGTAEAEDADMVEGALAEAGVEIPLELFTYDTSLADTHGADGITFENGLRCVIARYQPWLGSRDLTVSLDILPTADVATASTGDAEAAFMRTLQRTAARAVREAAFYSRSTLGALEGRPLVWSAGPPGLGELSEQAAAEWQEALQGNLRHVVAAEGLEPLAYWSVTRFGEVLGVIGGGRGGGEEALVNEIMASLSRLDFVISSINLAAGPLGASGAVLVGVATLYGQFLARLYAGVAVVVATLDGSRLGPSLRSAVLNAACNALKGLVGLGGLRFGEFDYVLGLLFGASSPLNCAG